MTIQAEEFLDLVDAVLVAAGLSGWDEIFYTDEMTKRKAAIVSM